MTMTNKSQRSLYAVKVSDDLTYVASAESPDEAVRLCAPMSAFGAAGRELLEARLADADERQAFEEFSKQIGADSEVALAVAPHQRLARTIQ